MDGTANDPMIELVIKYMHLLYPQNQFQDCVQAGLHSYKEYESALEKCGLDTTELRDCREQCQLAYGNLKNVTQKYHERFNAEMRKGREDAI